MPKKSSASTKNNFEANIFSSLKKRLEVKYEATKIPYVLHGQYKPDFTITRSDGSQVYIETKGFFRPEHKRKMAAVKKQHPDLDIRFVFYVNKYGRHDPKSVAWAIKYNFPYSLGTIPEEWFEELK